jgi:transglutaminase/protease-like cytokinesis protein 3
MKKICALLILGLAIQFNAFPQNQDEIARAIGENNCEILFDFIQEPQGKEKQLINNASHIIKRYATPDRLVRQYRTYSMDARVRSMGDFLTENVFIDPEKYLPLVVAKLMEDVRDKFLKVKILHDWLCYHIAYDADTFFGRARNNQDYISVIKNRKAICGGYAALFNQMCRLASIESVEINGYSKGYGYDEKKGASLDHAWNAVKIGNRWYLMDVTWDAGYLEGYAFIRSYSTYYLFLDSEPFRYTHLPAENKYQFYAPVMTKEEFEKNDKYKRQYSNRSYIDKISIEAYEQRVMPALDNLLEKKKITEREKAFFIEAYTKIPENGYYYCIEDQFAVERNNAVSKIYPRLNY